jgi:hypothetical protein
MHTSTGSPTQLGVHTLEHWSEKGRTPIGVDSTAYMPPALSTLDGHEYVLHCRFTHVAPSMHVVLRVRGCGHALCCPLPAPAKAVAFTPELMHQNRVQPAGRK